MKKWWIGAALAAVCVSQSARAQLPPGGGVVPDPVPVAPCPAPGGPGNLDFVPGPLNGTTAPPGPNDGLSLPADVPTAWGRGGTPESGAYLTLGALGLMRERPGHGIIAEFNGQPALTTHDLDPDYYWGGRVTFGYLCDDAAIELTGFYVPEQETAVLSYAPNQLTLPFRNNPLGFEGPTGAGLLTRADSVALRLKSSLGDAELNYRWWSRTTTGPEAIIGVRYMNVQERADITASSVQSGVNSPLDFGSLQASYTGRANNNLIMAQGGFEWEFPLTKWLSFGSVAKVAAGGDYVNVTNRAITAGGLVGANFERDRWTYASACELNLFLDIVQFEKVRLRAGYTAMWVVHVAEGFQQVTFDLSAQPGVRDSGSIFYHGPMIELELLF
ncbi:MAG TPA: BBP7 family outer membrane beta-barrel protein [Gemmataceae bacterium]|nr:BBP7 family outer membrane beta-barrel protein [Gemmataceae bacterium]